MRDVVVPLDVIEIHRRRHVSVLVKIMQVRPEIGVAHDVAEIAFEVAVIDRVEPD